MFDPQYLKNIQSYQLYSHFTTINQLSRRLKTYQRLCDQRIADLDEIFWLLCHNYFHFFNSLVVAKVNDFFM